MYYLIKLIEINGDTTFSRTVDLDAIAPVIPPPEEKEETELVEVTDELLAEVLPDICEKVGGKIKILVDGGIRTGYDVLKMLALGAESVLIGRDIIRAAVGGGTTGVKLQMNHLQKGLLKAMKMVGCKNLKQISKDVLYKD